MIQTETDQCWRGEPSGADGSRTQTGSRSKREENQQEVKTSEGHKQEGKKMRIKEGESKKNKEELTSSNSIAFFKPDLLKMTTNTNYNSRCFPLFCPHLLTTHLSILFVQVKSISSVFISRVKMHSTRYDLSPRPCPLPWCPPLSGPCWSSIAPWGQRDSRTTWSLASFLRALCLPGQQGAMFVNRLDWTIYFYTQLFPVWVSSLEFWEFWWCFPFCWCFSLILTRFFLVSTITYTQT